MTLQETKDQVAKDEGWGIWSNIINNPTVVPNMNYLVGEVARRYASSECAAKDKRIQELEKCLKDFVVWTEHIDDDGEGKEDWIILQQAKSLLTPKDKQP
jgi:hypothetical protein